MNLASSQRGRFVLRAPQAAYDEELETETSEQRDLWICSLNAAALQHRLAASAGQVTAEDVLQAKGMWQTLKNAVSDTFSAAAAGVAEEPIPVETAALRYARVGGALLRLSGERHPPRQGRLVVAGRRVRDSLLRSRCEVETGGCLSSSDAGVGTEFCLLLVSSREISEPPGESQVLNSASLLEPPRDSNLKFEVLYAFSDALDFSEPVASLPLLHCEVGEVTRCKYGNGWSLCIFEVAEETGLPGGASWLITVETREDCELWSQAAKAARWAARAQARGKRRAAEEALATFNSNPFEWCQAASRRLKQVADYAPPPPTLSAASRLRAWASPRTSKLQISLGGATGEGSIVSTTSSVHASVASWTPTAGAVDAATEAVRRVLVACDDVCGEAEGLLEAALAQRPLQQEAAGAALRCALIPALSTAGRCWSRWNADLPQAEARVLLRWLEARARAASNLGLVCPPLRSALNGLSAELSLRMGAHLRRLVASLLVSELGERLRGARAARVSVASSFAENARLSGSAPAASVAVSTLPVDFFTFVNSCLLDKDQGSPTYGLCCLRVAKFVIKELQECLRGWLWATLPEVPRGWNARQNDGLPTLLRRWFWGVTLLANALPSFQKQCQEITAHYSLVGRKDEMHSDDGEEECAEREDLGSDPVPKEWRFAREEQDFEAILEAFLWAACDVALGPWRRKVLNPGTVTSQAAQGSLVPSLNQLLNPNLQVLRSWLDPSLFERLLTKIFLVCIGCYILKLSCGSWLQGIRSRDDQVHFLSQEAVALCNYFAGMSKKPREDLDDYGLWEPGRVLNVLHAVLQLPGDKWRSGARRTGSPAQPKQPAQRKAPLPSDWKSPLGFEDGLGKLVSVLSDGPLPLDEVLNWFTDIDLPCSTPFQDLPRAVPAGGLYTGDTDVRRRTSRSSSMLSFSGRLERGRRASGSSCEDDNHSPPGFALQNLGGSNGGISLFGQAARRDSGDHGSLLMGNHEASEPKASTVLDNRDAIGLASEGAVCDLRIEQDGAYGAFCQVFSSLEDVPSTSEDHPRLRWVHLVKASPDASPEFRAPYFQILEFQPSALQVAHPQSYSAVVSLPLSKLKEVLQMSATSMGLVFEGTGGRPMPRYTLLFDCPSLVFRFRMVLQSWSAVEPPKEVCPVVAYMSNAGGQGLDELEEYGWRTLSAQPANGSEQLCHMGCRDFWGSFSLQP